MKINVPGDDLFYNRLLSYLDDVFPFHVKAITPIRKKVYLIEGEEDIFILKGFSSYHRLKLQETFTATLKKEGFKNTYSFVDHALDPPLFFEQTYYGCLEYITPSEPIFSYEAEKDRLEGLSLLREYHQITSKFAKRYGTIMGSYKLLDKWRERTGKFLTNTSVIRFFVQKEIMDEWLKWADWSLKGLEKEIDNFQKGPKVILHGDVAHHNFIRSRNDQLFLIDFDLISLGHESNDILQYANRILPYLNWSLDRLLDMNELKPFLKEKGFLYALAFPTDIFREWNRLIRERHYDDPTKVRKILDFTAGQFPERIKFVRELKSILK
ncbi:phosphotransferase [Bacillus dakarensis]|uniref:phosphotransferase n=1 Tax=Robertmurraya dakarensis TaxID=1926278 RepID=UPI00098137CC|nr:phosphotransferase [Bacillus dakarensis]